MSVAIARAAPVPTYPFSGDADEYDHERVDWGTATPINSRTVIELEDDFSYVVSKRGVKRKAIPETGEQLLPRTQKALLLREVRQPFALAEDHQVPEVLAPDEVIIRIQAIGLNPIDWKSADYGYGIPELPYVSGRDFAGTVVKAPATKSHLRVGDTILCPSTDYRDLRKAAYQEYAVATTSTVCRLPDHVSVSQGAALGVAYVAAGLALGVCLGLRMPNLGSNKGPDLLSIVRNTSLGDLPQDASVIQECLAIKEVDRPRIKDWLVIWGGSSTSALFLSQIARLAGMKVILVVDVAKHGSRLMDANGCLCVDSHDAERAVEVIRGITGGSLRFAIDTVGKQTSEHLAKCFQIEGQEDTRAAHLVGLAALPKERLPGVVYHSVPVKLFHEVPAVGSAMMKWLEQALQSRSTLELPRVDEAPGGLGGINDALDLMRQGHVSGRRLVVPL